MMSSSDKKAQTEGEENSHTTPPSTVQQLGNPVGTNKEPVSHSRDLRAASLPAFMHTPVSDQVGIFKYYFRILGYVLIFETRPSFLSPLHSPHCRNMEETNQKMC